MCEEELSLKLGIEQSLHNGVRNLRNDCSSTKPNTFIEATRNSVNKENYCLINAISHSTNHFPLQPWSFKHGWLQSFNSMPVLCLDMAKVRKMNCRITEPIAMRNAELTKLVKEVHSFQMNIRNSRDKQETYSDRKIQTYKSVILPRSLGFDSAAFHKSVPEAIHFGGKFLEKKGIIESESKW